MKKLMLLALVVVLAGCGDPNYVDPNADDGSKNLPGRPIPTIERQPSAS